MNCRTIYAQIFLPLFYTKITEFGTRKVIFMILTMKSKCLRNKSLIRYNELLLLMLARIFMVWPLTIKHFQKVASRNFAAVTFVINVDFFLSSLFVQMQKLRKRTKSAKRLLKGRPTRKERKVRYTYKPADLVVSVTNKSTTGRKKQ